MENVLASGQQKMQTAYWLHTIVFRVRKQWDYFKSRLSLIIRVNIVLNRTVVVDSDWCSDNLCGSQLLSQSELYHVTWWYYTLVIDLFGQLRLEIIGRLSVKPWCHWLWRLVKLLSKWHLGSNISQLYLVACENSTTDTFRTANKLPSIKGVCLEG